MKEKDINYNLELEGKNGSIYACKFNNIWHEYHYVRNNLPQKIMVDNLNKKLILKNRNEPRYRFEYKDNINIINKMSVPKKFKQSSLITVFTDSKNPWRRVKEDYQNLKYISKEYYNILDDYEVLNSNENIDYLFNL